MFDAGLRVEEPARGLVIVTIDRPAARNALTTASGRALVDLYTRLAMRPEMRALVITGSGDRAFCSGADLKERATLNAEAARAQHLTHRLGLTLRGSFEFPVIAAVNGAAHGGGAELALSSDLVIAATNARFALPELQRGVMPGMGGTQFLARALGGRRALDLLLSGAELDAPRAEELGLVNRVVPPDRLMDEVMRYADRLMALPPLAVQAAVRSTRGAADFGGPAGLALELALHQRLMASEDRVEGARAFAEGRPPVWQGR
ncbi:enoyl-CoA hydratase/isomerase family protein [Pseudooceanicola aestuarii]|uniref:enoyl-CoA hydratase/isomerase family protein n=1 Tax=Pseudooceanicola aestuarii TaxID=2697319 RepID=UPI0013D46962|nr:enoyl-CoA hydratase-related protein [Pseudooceanicola aestuarii]